MHEFSDKPDGQPTAIAKKAGKSNNPLVISTTHLLKDLKEGRIKIRWPDAVETEHGQGGQCVFIEMHNTTPIRRLFFGGHNGFAESYFQGDWSCDDLTALFAIVMHNEALFSDTLTGKWLARIKNVFHHLSKRNSLAGSKRNISYHYDLGNSFYELWLDDSMTYSSGLFADDEMSLAQAQQGKLERVGALLTPEPGSKVLEIGCGWGALGNHLVSTTDCDVVGVSLSQAQLDYARQRHSRAGLAFEFQDYRDLAGRFDHIVSIEMFEAVGMAYWNTYFKKLSALLNDKGSVLLQVITIDESRFERYRKTPDFIQRYVFPGGMLPTKTHLRELAEQSGFEIKQSQWFGASYATTLRRWKINFENSLDDVRAMGYDEAFIRLWRYYLSYCEIGFMRGTTDVGLVLLAKTEGTS
jgi:cyclopropane-fatty-acyl-phospholipid synthase